MWLRLPGRVNRDFIHLGFNELVKHNGKPLFSKYIQLLEKNVLICEKKRSKFAANHWSLTETDIGWNFNKHWRTSYQNSPGKNTAAKVRSEAKDIGNWFCATKNSKLLQKQDLTSFLARFFQSACVNPRMWFVKVIWLSSGMFFKWFQHFDLFPLSICPMKTHSNFRTLDSLKRFIASWSFCSCPQSGKKPAGKMRTTGALGELPWVYSHISQTPGPAVTSHGSLWYKMQ